MNKKTKPRIKKSHIRILEFLNTSFRNEEYSISENDICQRFAKKFSQGKIKDLLQDLLRHKYVEITENGWLVLTKRGYKFLKELDTQDE